ncbi:MAG: response regulator [Desulfuromonadales bacterium]
MPKHKILLVDDVDFFLEVEKGFLQQTPATILTARDGLEALEIAAREKPDLIYLDVNMPVMDGLTCCRKLKSDPHLAAIPVVMVFAPGREASADLCRAAGCDGVVTKPIDRNLFLDLGHGFLFQVERREPRKQCQALITLQRPGEQEFSGTCDDLSENGVYVACREKVQANEMLQMKMVLPGVGMQPVSGRVRVAWVNQGFPRPKLNHPQGFGAAFQSLSAAGREIILKVIQPPKPLAGRGD